MARQGANAMLADASAADKQAFIEKMNSHRQKLRQAMLKEDATLEPVFAKIDKHISQIKAKQLDRMQSSSSPTTCLHRVLQAPKIRDFFTHLYSTQICVPEKIKVALCGESCRKVGCCGRYKLPFGELCPLWPLLRTRIRSPMALTPRVGLPCLRSGDSPVLRTACSYFPRLTGA